MKEHFTFFGFKINTKKFIISAIVTLCVVLLLVGLDLLGVDISWYGVIIGGGFLLAVIIATQLAPERGIYKDFSYDIIWWVFPFAIIGARVFYVLNSLHEFDTFVDTLKIWEGGLSIFGGIFGGALAVIIFCRIKKLNVLKTMDVIAPVLILGQAIGRWGNFLNAEVYGFEITNSAWQWFPFGVNINGTWHLATFFYESVLNLAGFFVLVTLLRKNKNTGVVVSAYLFWYGTVRAVLESLRVEKYILYIPGTTVQFSSLVSIIIAVIGLGGLIYIYIKNRKIKNKGA